MVNASNVVRLLRPLAIALYRFRRRIATVGVAVLACVIGVHVVFGANGMVVYQKKRAEYRDLQQETQRLQQENDRLTQENKALKSSPAAIEREAREQLHLTRPGETVYVVPADQQPTPQRPAAATAQNTDSH